MKGKFELAFISFEQKIKYFSEDVPGAKKFGYFLAKSRIIFEQVAIRLDQLTKKEELIADAEKLKVIKILKGCKNVFDYLYNIAGKELGRMSEFNKKETFNNLENSYKQKFSLLAERTYANLLSEITPADNAKGQLDYFSKFLEMITFLCVTFNFKLSIDPENSIIGYEKITDKNDYWTRPVSYYLFYNRSATSNPENEKQQAYKKDNRIRLGLINSPGYGCKVTAEFYYSPGQEELVLNKKYKSISYSGSFTEHGKDIVSLLLKPAEPNIETKGNNKPGPADYYFLIKWYKKRNEKILLGTCSFWNSKQRFPFSSVVVLVEAEEYENNNTDPAYSFDAIKNNRSNNNIPPVIFYYLFRQSISLEKSLEFSPDHANRPYEYFSKLEDLPYNTREGEYIKDIEGFYRGLSVVSNETTDHLIISGLSILKSSEVKLNLKISGVSKSIYGHIKQIERDDEGHLRLYFSLFYKRKNSSTSIHYFLEASKERNQDNSYSFYLKGSFAGISVFTDKATSSGVIFKKVKDGTTITPELLNLKNADVTEIGKLYRENKDMFDFQLGLTGNHYTSVRGVKKLTEIINSINMSGSENAAGFDLFISIPLIHADKPAEYEMNCRLAAEIRDALGAFNIPGERIFCACFNGKTTYSFDEYKRKGANKTDLYKKVRNVMRSCRHFIIVFPENYHMGIPSTMLVELGFILGFKDQKNFLILYESGIQDFLPGVIKGLYTDNMISFNKTDTISKQFKELKDEIKKHLGLFQDSVR